MRSLSLNQTHFLWHKGLLIEPDRGGGQISLNTRTLGPKSIKASLPPARLTAFFCNLQGHQTQLPLQFIMKLSVAFSLFLAAVAQATVSTTPLSQPSFTTNTSRSCTPSPTTSPAMRMV